MENLTAKRVIAIAQAEIGYLEKKTNSQLDDKTANAGSGNYTKYARDLDAIANFYNGRKNGFDWCDVFVDWCFVAAFGAEKAKQLLCQPDKSCGAGCLYSANYFKVLGQFHTVNPKPGDQIFFWNSGKTGVAHTGLVCKVDSRYVYTVEGNTSSATGVVANGGCVAQKQYALGNGRIYGYGRPAYEEEASWELPTLKKGDRGDAVRALQILLIGNGCDCGKWGADGDFGASTEKAVNAYCKKKNLAQTGMADSQVWKNLLGLEVAS